MNLRICLLVIGTGVSGFGCSGSVTPGGNSSPVSCGTSRGCEAGAPAGSFSVEVSVFVTADDRKKSPAIAWLDDPPTPLGARGLWLRRTFATAEEAHAFEGTFVVFLDSKEVARDIARFSECDAVADVGLAPSLVKEVTVLRSLDNGALSRDTHSNENAPHGCYLTPLEPPDLSGPKQILFRLPSDDALTFTVGGAAVQPRAIQIFSPKLWEVMVTPKAGSDGGLGELSVANGASVLGHIPLSFKSCTQLTTKTVVEEDLLLKASSDGGTASVDMDPYGGVTCDYSDGTSSGAIP